MTFKILHLNVERNRHTKAVIKLLEEKKPDVVCFAEAMYEDIKTISSKLGYDFAFATRFIFKDNEKSDQEGSAILSKYPILNIGKCRYDDKILKNPITHTEKDWNTKDKERPKNRFLEKNTLLTALIQINEKQTVTISTTHFPVTDHSTPGLSDHDIKSWQNIDDLEHADVYLDRLIKNIRSLIGPVVFTADLNNPRGEYVYDTIAHELVDRVPISLKSSIDPSLHRVKGLELMIDTIMTTPDISVKSFEVIEGVSDHKAFLALLQIAKHLNTRKKALV